MKHRRRIPSYGCFAGDIILSNNQHVIARKSTSPDQFAIVRVLQIVSHCLFSFQCVLCGSPLAASVVGVSPPVATASASMVGAGGVTAMCWPSRPTEVHSVTSSA